MITPEDTWFARPPERVKRIDLPRTGPIRSVATVLRPARIPEAGGVVPQAIKNAYQVLDEQMRHGREAANHHRGSHERGVPMREEPEDTSSTVVRVWSEMFGIWLELWGPFAPSSLRKAVQSYGRSGAYDAESYPDHDHARARHEAHERVHITFQVSTPRHLAVTLDLAPNVDPAMLVVQDLCAVTPNGHGPITGASLKRVDNRLIVDVTVLPQQPDGIYLGTIADRKHFEVRGSLRVVVRT